MDKRYFSNRVVKWYLENKRSLPWRETRDPYKIWLSEIILQQTRVAQGLPYYERFIKKYPNVVSLAKADQQDVLRLWQGLGYYTRARNLHKCAQLVVQQYNGAFPCRYQDLIKLPGIGDYTAAAIASFSSEEPVAVVDGNVYRVLSRVFGIQTIINSPEGKKQFNRLANELLDIRQPGLYNQAIMEFGALHCTPKNPGCDTCVIRSGCFAHQHDLQETLPVKAKPARSRKRYFYYVVIEKKKSLLMKKRTEKDIWHGLFDFHLIEKTRPVSAKKLMNEDETLAKLVDTAEKVEISPLYKHILSHQTIFCRFIHIYVSRNVGNKVDKRLAFYPLKKVAGLPKPVLVNRFLADRLLL